MWGGVNLENRLMAAAYFSRNTNLFNGAFETGAQATAGTSNPIDFGILFGSGQGQWFDGLYEESASSFASAPTFTFSDPLNGINTPFWSDSETGNVSATVSGPGTGLPRDPNPPKNPDIQFNVKHSGTDTISTYIPNVQPTGSMVTLTSSNNPITNGDQFAYTVNNSAGNSTVTSTFQASFSSTIPHNYFSSVASLTLTSTYMNVTIAQNGLTATNNLSKQTIKQDGNFEVGNPGINSSDTASMIVNNAPNGTSFSIAFSSGLSSHPSNVVMNMGQYTNQTSFNRSLQVQVS